MFCPPAWVGFSEVRLCGRSAFAVNTVINTVRGGHAAVCPSASQLWPFSTDRNPGWGISENIVGKAGERPVVFDTVVHFSGILNSFLSEHKACPSPRGTRGGGGGEGKML